MQVPTTSGNNDILIPSGLKSFDFRPLSFLIYDLLNSNDTKIAMDYQIKKHCVQYKYRLRGTEIQ